MVTKTFVISDTHFQHGRILILEGTRQLFSKTVEEMNEKLIKNWNNTVSKDDIVYHLGDFSFATAGNTSEEVRQNILPLLNGHTIIVQGNHDLQFKGSKGAWIKYGGFDFFMTHNPSYLPRELLNLKAESKTWIVHGHYHSKTPLLDFDRHWANVSVENINYTPLQLNTLCKLIKKKI